MGDMLIRGIDAELKRRLEDSARRNKRSLSEEAIVVMQKGFALQESRTDKAGARLRSLVGGLHFTDDEVEAIERLRKEGDRAPPTFD